MNNDQKELLESIFNNADSTTGTTLSTADSTTAWSDITTLGDITDGSGLTWTYDSATTHADLTNGWQTDNGTTSWTVEIPKATKEELQKIIKNTAVQIEIDGVMKEAKLSDLLETGYLTLKTL